MRARDTFPRRSGSRKLARHCDTAATRPGNTAHDPPDHPRDTPGLLEIARGTGVFKPPEIVALREVLDDYHAGNATPATAPSPWSTTAEPIGFAYYAPAR